MPAHPLKKIGNLVLLAFTLVTTFSISVLLITQDGLRTVSTEVYGYSPEAPLMGSYLVEVVLHPVIGYALAAFMVFLVVKEFRMEDLRRRVLLNLTGFVITVFFSITYAWVYSHGYLFSPA